MHSPRREQKTATRISARHKDRDQHDSDLIPVEQVQSWRASNVM
jgi:hypothetical protein